MQDKRLTRIAQGIRVAGLPEHTYRNRWAEDYIEEKYPEMVRWLHGIHQLDVENIEYPPVNRTRQREDGTWESTWHEDTTKNLDRKIQAARDEAYAKFYELEEKSGSNFKEMPPEYQWAAVWGWDMFGITPDGLLPNFVQWEWGVTPFEDFYLLASRSLGYDHPLVSGGDSEDSGKVAEQPIFLASGSNPPHTLTGIFDGWHRLFRQVGDDVSWVKTESTNIEGI